MYTEYFNTRLKKLVIMDKNRIHKLGKLVQNCFFYIIFTFIISLLINDIFPEFDNKKPKLIILFEVILQILILCLLIFYLRKIVLLFPYIFSKFNNLSLDQTDISSQYSEIIIIMIIIISTQGQLFKKINYLFFYINNKSNEYDLDQLQITKQTKQIVNQPSNDMIQNIPNNNTVDKNKENNDDYNNQTEKIPRYEPLITTNYVNPSYNPIEIDKKQFEYYTNKNLKPVEKGSMQHFLSNLQKNIVGLDSPSNLHYSSYYLPSQNSNQINENFKSFNSFEINQNNLLSNNDSNDNTSNFKNNLDKEIEHFQNNIDQILNKPDLKILDQTNSRVSNLSQSKSSSVPTSKSIEKKLIEDYFPKKNHNYDNNNIQSNNNLVKNFNIDNNSPIRVPDYNSLINQAYSNTK